LWTTHSATTSNEDLSGTINHLCNRTIKHLKILVLGTLLLQQKRLTVWSRLIYQRSAIRLQGCDHWKTIGKLQL